MITWVLINDIYEGKAAIKNKFTAINGIVVVRYYINGSKMMKVTSNDETMR